MPQVSHHFLRRFEGVISQNGTFAKKAIVRIVQVGRSRCKWWFDTSFFIPDFKKKISLPGRSCACGPQAGGLVGDKVSPVITRGVWIEFSVFDCEFVFGRFFLLVQLCRPRSSAELNFKVVF